MTEENNNRIPNRYQLFSQETQAAHIDQAVQNRASKSVCHRVFSPFGDDRITGGALARVAVLSMLLILVVAQQVHGSASDRDTLAPASHTLSDMKMAAAAPTAGDETADSTATSQPLSYYLQVGAFHEQDRAIVLKKKLSRMGLKSEIQEASIDDTGVYHRVCVGPFTNPRVLARTKLKLYALGFESRTLKK